MYLNNYTNKNNYLSKLQMKWNNYMKIKTYQNFSFYFTFTYDCWYLQIHHLLLLTTNWKKYFSLFFHDVHMLHEVATVVRLTTKQCVIWEHIKRQPMIQYLGLHLCWHQQTQEMQKYSTVYDRQFVIFPADDWHITHITNRTCKRL